jgi:hypothetical protein
MSANCNIVINIVDGKYYLVSALGSTSEKEYSDSVATVELYTYIDIMMWPYVGPRGP